MKEGPSLFYVLGSRGVKKEAGCILLPLAMSRLSIYDNEPAIRTFKLTFLIVAADKVLLGSWAGGDS